MGSMLMGLLTSYLYYTIVTFSCDGLLYLFAILFQASSLYLSVNLWILFKNVMFFFSLVC